MKKKWFHRKEQKELEGKIDAKNAQLEKAKATLDLIPAQHGYQNALEVTKAMKLAKAELKKAQQAQKVWDAPEPETGENVSEDSGECAECGETEKGRKALSRKRVFMNGWRRRSRSWDDSLTKKKQRSGMEL